jgi:DNA-binding response OmpR family regulator
MLKILVVDDEVEVCDFVKNFFSERNFEVITAYNGEEALHLIEAQTPEIVLLDIKMPVMDGMQMLKEVRRRNKHCKIIMVTAVDDTEKAQEARNYGAVGYITKPLSLEQLEQSVLALAEEISAAYPK